MAIREKNRTWKGLYILKLSTLFTYTDHVGESTERRLGMNCRGLTAQWVQNSPISSFISFY